MYWWQLYPGGELHHILGEYLRQPFAQIQGVGPGTERLGFGDQPGLARTVSRPVECESADALSAPRWMN
jgi:hypothetical protein